MTALAAMDLPLPTTLPRELIIKAGNRMEGCRDKGTATMLTLVVHEGYDVLYARVSAIFDANDDLDCPDTIEIYIKPTNYATQKDYDLLDRDGFIVNVQAAWHKARLRKGGRTDFVVNIPRMREAFEAAGVDFGPASLRYAATVQARLPDDVPPLIPHNQTFSKLQHIDALDRQWPPPPTTTTSTDGFAPIDIMINGVCVRFEYRVADVQRPLGLPLYPLYA